MISPIHGPIVTINISARSGVVGAHKMLAVTPVRTATNSQHVLTNKAPTTSFRTPSGRRSLHRRLPTRSATQFTRPGVALTVLRVGTACDRQEGVLACHHWLTRLHQKRLGCTKKEL